MVRNRDTTIAVDPLREQQLEELFAYYVDRLNEGDELNPQEILAKHPELGTDLIEHLEGYIDPGAAPSMPSDRTLGDYTIRREIGRGGMGIVYDAWQNSLDRRVALKVLPLGIAASDRAFERFMREARTAAKLDHQNIVRVHGMGVEANTPYYSMEYVEGRTLAQILGAMEAHSDAAEDAPFAPASDGSTNYTGIARTFAEVADGLQHAHEKGVTHRDIKPSNLILTVDGHLRILDFGLARFEGDESLTLTGDLLGTPMYMSPEQARRRKIPVDHRTDIYSLGATLYEVLTQRPPFRGKDNYETLSQIIANDLSPLRRFDPTIPKSLETIVLKCLRKNPKDRYDTAEAVAEDLRRFAQGEPVEAQPLPPWAGVARKAWKYSPRIGVIVMTATLIFFVISLLMPTKGIVTRQVLAPALGGMGMPSPDGRYLSTVNWEKGNLAVHDFTTGKTRDITDEGTWKKPNQFCDVSIWSPDSRQIAYFWYHESSGTSLRIVGLDGAKPRVLLAGDSARGEHAPWPRAWSRDGKFIVALFRKKDETVERGYQRQIVLVSVADGSLRVLKSLGERNSKDMSISPDGRYVVYELEEEPGSKKRDIHLLATDGSGDVPLVEHPADDKAPYWTPDGKRVVFLSDRSGAMGVWILNVDDGKPRGTPALVKETGRRFQPMGFTRDGSLYYRVGNPAADVYVATLDFEAGKVLSSPTKTSLRFEGSNFAPTWSPDGKYLAYASRRDTQDNYLLVIRSVDTGEERDLSPSSLRMLGAHAHGAPQWSPDGRSILVAGKANSANGLYLVDVQTGEFNTIIEYGLGSQEPNFWPRWPVFSNDGTQIYYIRDRSIVALDLETRGEKELYRANKYIVRLACSPDGRRLAFFESTQDERPAVVKTVSTSGGEPRELFTLEKVQTLFWGVGISWTPDGRHLIVAGPDVPDKQGADRLPDELWRYPIAGGEPVKLSLGIKIRQMSMHPDGRRFAFASHEPKGGAEVWVLENFLP